MIVLKDSQVQPNGLCPEMYYALGVAAALKSKLFGLKTVITSLTDGIHNLGSLHPAGKAGDLRTIDLTPAEATTWKDAIAEELEPMGFDVVWEGGMGATPATTGAHVHIEFQPKAGEMFWHTQGEK